MQVLRELSATNSKVDKIRILKRHDSEGLRTLLKLTYDKTDTYGIKCPGSWLDYVLQRKEYLQPQELSLLKKLRYRHLTGSAAQIALNEVLLEQGSLIRLVLNRDLECGIAATTINKAFPGLIPQFKIQKAKEVPLSEVKFPISAQLKYDGARFIAIHKGGRTTFRTSNGKYINAPKFAALIGDLGGDYMLDGELVYRGGKMSDRSVASGRLTSAMSTGVLDESELNWFVFDCLPLRDFERGKCDMGYIERGALLYHFLNRLQDSSIQIAINVYCKDEQSLQDKLDNLYANGYEGLILKAYDHLYEFKRNKSWIKLKQVKTADLECFGYEEHSKDESQIGSLRLRGVVEKTYIEVSVGSGLSNMDRHRDPDYYLGRTIEIKYNGLVQDHRTSKSSLFLPRYVTVRVDK